MYLKLAWRNIRRSIRDYAIYFVTLLVGVAIFYAFNSVEGQQVLFDIESGTQQRMVEATQYMLSMVSVLVACVLGFLIIYANQFLIKRRKREFGIYLTLGMSPGGVSRIVLYETVMVGLVSLVVGLAIGIALSQGMSFLTASLFGTTMRDYHFVVSTQAIITTVICFAVAYVVVAVFNMASVSRLTLANLLSAGARSQRMPVRNPWVCLVVFAAAIGCLAYAYQQLFENGLVMLDDPAFHRATIFMLVGSLLFFWSLAGFVIAVLTRARGAYLRGLVPFTVRQIASRVNTAFLSLWAVCVMLFFAITIFSGGMGMIEVFVGDVQRANPYSATLRADVWYENPKDISQPHSAAPNERAEQMQEAEPEAYAAGMAAGWDMAEPLRAADPQLWDQTVAASAQVNMYEIPGITYGQLRAQLPDGGAGLVDADFEEAMESNLITVPISQLNALREMMGQPAVQLAADECLIINNMAPTKDLAQALASSGIAFDAQGSQLRFNGEVLDMQLDDNSMLSSALILAVPDGVVDGLVDAGAIPNMCYLDVMYADNGLTPVQNGEALGRILAAAQPLASDEGKGYARADETYQTQLWPVTMMVTADEMITQSSGLRMMITYLAVYIGFVLLVATAAVLAIQSLSLAADSELRYRMLWRLGADARMLKRSLFAQTLIYFLVPLGLAVCHSACAISVLADSMFAVFLVDAATPALTAAALVLGVYGIYFLVTYFASSSIVAKATRVS